MPGKIHRRHQKQGIRYAGAAVRLIILDFKRLCAFLTDRRTLAARLSSYSIQQMKRFRDENKRLGNCSQVLPNAHAFLCIERAILTVSRASGW